MEITHPFHPYRGQQFLLLKSRRVSGTETLILQGSERGSFAVPREWTNMAAPSVTDELGLPPVLLDVSCLLSLVELVDRLTTRAARELDK